MTVAKRTVDNGTGTDIDVLVDSRTVGGLTGDAPFTELLEYPPPQRVQGRYLDGLRHLFTEDFRAPILGMFNDGVGSASRDSTIWFAGNPSMRLDVQGNDAGAPTDPGRTANVGGVVVKRRIHDNFSGVFALEAWFRMTSTNLTSNTFLSMSVYNRDGSANAYHGRVWLDPNGNNQPMIGKILDGAATAAANGGTPLTGTTAVYTTATTSSNQNGAGSHLFEPVSGRMDVAGGWHYARLAVNLSTKKYVSLQLDSESPVDLSAYDMDHTTSSGFGGMHFSFEFCASTSTRPRYVNIAAVRGFGG